jgi:hypothetical protein
MSPFGRISAFQIPTKENSNSKKEIEFRNVERVREYLEKNLGCMNKEVQNALNLHPRTVAKAIKIINGKKVD